MDGRGCCGDFEDSEASKVRSGGVFFGIPLITYASGFLSYVEALVIGKKKIDLFN